LAVLLAAPALLAAERVTLRLDQPTKTERIGLPVSGGLPFAKGRLAAVDHLRLLNAAGKELPLQARALSLWPDGSVKAAMLDFQADIAADRNGAVTLEYGAGVKAALRAKGIQIKAAADKVTLDTGAAVYTFSKSGCGWMDELTVGGNSVGKGIHFARFKGDAAPNKAVVTALSVEDGKGIPNPLRAVVKVEGYYDGHLKTPFILRVHAYADKPFVKVVHTFVYAGDRFRVEDHMTELEIGLELSGGAKKILYGIEGRREGVEPKPANGAALLYSSDDLNFTITGRSEEPKELAQMPVGWWMSSKGKPAGWMAVSGDAGCVQMGCRDLWQNYPKGLRIEGNRATLALWPREHAPFDLRTNARFIEDKGKGEFRWNDSTPELEAGSVSGTHASKGTGSSKAHELYFNFQASLAPEALTAAFNAFQEPTYLYAGARWYADTRIFDAFNPAGLQYPDANLKRWDDVIELSARWLLFMPRYWRWYGMWDYGDLVFCGPSVPDPKHPEPRFPVGPRPPVAHGRFDVDAKFKTNWGANGHYDTIQAMLLHFMRTGQREYLRWAEVAALHINEVDGMYPTGQEERGRPGAADGAASAEDPDAAGEEGKGLYGYISRHGCGHGQVSASHCFIRHRIPLYYLTGNERIREAMGLAFESAVKAAPDKIFTSNTVRPCSAVTSVMETWWSMSGEPQARDATQFLLDYWLSRQQTQGDRGSYVAENRTYGRNKDGSNEVFDPYKRLPEKQREVKDPNSWESSKTHGWRLMNFGATEAMMDWYSLTGDEKVGQSVVRFIRATKIHGTHYGWYHSQQPLAFAWRLTKDEAFRDWLRDEIVWPKWGELEKPETTIVLKDQMSWEDFNREFGKFYNDKTGKGMGGFPYMSQEDCTVRILLMPCVLYTFDPYDKAFPSATSIAAKAKAPGADEARESAVEEKIAWGKETRGQVASLRALATAMEPGEPIEFEIRVKNVSKEDVYLPSGLGGEKMSACFWTFYFDQWEWRSAQLSCKNVPLKPGETASVRCLVATTRGSMTAEQERRFPFLSPVPFRHIQSRQESDHLPAGSYRVRAMIGTIENGYRVESNTIEVRFVDRR
jgi:hypothetical protein